MDPNGIPQTCNTGKVMMKSHEMMNLRRGSCRQTWGISPNNGSINEDWKVSKKSLVLNQETNGIEAT